MNITKKISVPMTFKIKIKNEDDCMRSCPQFQRSYYGCNLPKVFGDEIDFLDYKDGGYIKKDFQFKRTELCKKIFGNGG